MSAISGTSTIAERAALERARGRAQVDLGLAAAGDAVEQQARRRPAVEGGVDPRDARARLGRRRARAPSAARADRRRSRAGARRSRPRARRARAPRGAQRARGRSRRAGQRRGRGAARAPRAGAAPSRAPAPSSAARPSGGELRPQRAPRCAYAGARRCRCPAGARARARGRASSSTPRRPKAEPDELRRHAALERLERLDQLLGRDLAVLGGLDDHAQHAPAPERARAARCRRRRPSRPARGSRTGPRRARAGVSGSTLAITRPRLRPRADARGRLALSARHGHRRPRAKTTRSPRYARTQRPLSGRRPPGRACPRPPRARPRRARRCRGRRRLVGRLLGGGAAVAFAFLF